MIDCLENYIGVRGIAGLEDPDSGYYINDLQGITTQELEDISDDDQYETRLTWDDIYARSSRLLETDIKNALKKYFKRYSYIQNNITGQLRESSSVTLTQSNVFNGWSFDMGFESKNLVLNISTFDIFLNSAVDFSIFVYDLNTGEKLDEIAYTGVAGLNTFRINKNYALHRRSNIFVCYDASVVSVKKMLEYNPGSYSRSGAVSKTSTIVSTNFDGADTGMSLTYNLECSVSNFVCQRIDSFKDAFLYKLGVEFCSERIYSDRINRYTLMDREDAEKLRIEFNDQYALLIDAALKDLKLNGRSFANDDTCFECNPVVAKKAMLP